MDSAAGSTARNEDTVCVRDGAGVCWGGGAACGACTIGTPDGAVREMGETGCAGGAVTGGPCAEPSKDSVCVRCVGKLGRAALVGATTGGRGAAKGGGANGAWTGATTGGAGEVTAAVTTGAALPDSRAIMAFFTLSMIACESNGLSMKSSTPASLPRLGS